MYEKEEVKLNEMKERLGEIHLPLDEADDAIRQGFDRAKRDKATLRIKQNRIWSVVVAALLFVSFVTSIRVSPVFANAVASIPGMEKFVDFVQFDKGLEAIFINDYYQKVDAVQTKSGLTLTIDGVILDETGMNIYYTMQSKEPVDGFSIQSVDLKNAPPGGISYGGGSSPFEKSREWASEIKYYFQEPTLFKDLSFTVEMDVLFQGETISFSLPFELKENVKPGKTIVLNEEVEIESQKLTIKEVTIYPLRVAVHIAFDEANSMEILGFEDMRLEDENGEVWGSIRNGVSARGREIYYLQSNYFEEPKQLYLRINKLQALDKDESTLVINTEKGEILNGPKDGRLQVLKSSKSRLYLIMPDREGDRSHTYDIFSTGKDVEGKEINFPRTGMYVDEEGTRHWDATIGTTNYTNPISINLTYYPNYINGNVKIELDK